MAALLLSMLALFGGIRSSRQISGSPKDLSNSLVSLPSCFPLPTCPPHSGLALRLPVFNLIKICDENGKIK
jgi:hypothetical protein